MKRTTIALCLLAVFFGSISAFAQENKVVVIPLNSTKVGGSDSQVQYNNNGKLDGANVFYNKDTNNLGIGVTPSSTYRLIVSGSGSFSKITGEPGLVISRSAPKPFIGSYWTAVEGNMLNAYYRSGLFPDDENLYLNNESSGHILLVNGGGGVGIGIGDIDPVYTLHVNGSVGATGGYFNPSSKDFKKDIQPVNNSDQTIMLAKLMDMDLKTYKYREEFGGDGTTKIGFIAEEMPEELVSKDRKGVDIYELLVFTIGALKAQNEKLKMLEQLKSENNDLKALVCRDHAEATICL